MEKFIKEHFEKRKKNNSLFIFKNLQDNKENLFDSFSALSLNLTVICWSFALIWRSSTCLLHNYSYLFLLCNRYETLRRTGDLFVLWSPIHFSITHFFLPRSMIPLSPFFSFPVFNYFCWLVMIF